jgi:hypothetical protein
MAQHLPKTWGQVNGKAVARPLPDGNSGPLPESMKLQMKLHKILHHFTPAGKIGYPQGITCWCGDTLEFALHDPGQDAKRKAFFDEHEECQPPSEVQS